MVTYLLAYAMNKTIILRSISKHQPNYEFSKKSNDRSTHIQIMAYILCNMPNFILHCLKKA